MKGSTAYGLIWLSTALAVSVTVFVIKSPTPLWGMLIPTLVSFSSED